jgi:hypothetical protein
VSCEYYLVDEDEESYEACYHECYNACETVRSRVIALCRDHNDNILFEAEVETIEDVKTVFEECKRYVDNTWVDFVYDLR